MDEFQRLEAVGVLGEDERLELIAGEIVQMAPIGSSHAACVDRFNRFFTAALRDLGIVRVQSLIELTSSSMPQPDLTLLRPREDFYAGAHPLPQDVLLVVEVADTSLPYDRDRKLPLYARAGIREVWLADVQRRTVALYREPETDGYERVETARRTDSIAPLAFPEARLTVAALLPVHH